MTRIHFLYWIEWQSRIEWLFVLVGTWHVDCALTTFRPCFKASSPETTCSKRLMRKLYALLKTPKTIPSWAVHTRVGQIRERPLPNPRLELPLAVWMLLSCYVFPQGLRMVLIQANSSPTLSMPRWELLIPVWMLLTSYANSPPPPTTQPPGRVTLPVWM